MKNIELFNAIGEISDSLIAEANTAPHGNRILKIISIAAATLLLGVAAVAAPIIYVGSHSDGTNIPDYYTVPSAETLLADAGLNVNVPESLSGFAFKSGHIRNDDDYDVSGNVILKYKSLLFKYSEGGDTLYVSVDSSPNFQISGDDAATVTYGGCEIEYASYMNKLVPGNYVPTEQDKKDEASGKYVFSYGASEMIVNEVRMVLWKDNGINYTITATNSPLSEDELVGAAREMIDAQR